MQTHQSITMDAANALTHASARAFPAWSLWRWARILLALVALGTCDGLREVGADTEVTTPALTLQRFGTPCFRPVDFHLFSADITDFFGLLTRPKGLLPEPNHQFRPELGVGHGRPHNPPYNREIKAGLVRLGLVDQVRFAPEDFQLPKAILFAFMATTGASTSPTISPPGGWTRSWSHHVLIPVTNVGSQAALMRYVPTRRALTADKAMACELGIDQKADGAAPQALAHSAG